MNDQRPTRPFAAWFAVALVTLSALTAQADQTFTVTNSTDSGTGTLRWALIQPCTGTRTIAFGFSEKTIQLADTLTITGVTVISGMPNNILSTNGFRVTISGGGSVRPFTVPAGASLRLENITLANGSGTEGGAIRNEGSLWVVRSALLDNSATSGGAIYNSGTTVVSSCTFSGNSADRGGVVYQASGYARLQYVTASENSAVVAGGAIYAGGGTQMVHRSILWGNAAPTWTNPPYSTQIADANSTTVSVTQTIIEGGYPGTYDTNGLTMAPYYRGMTNNLDTDPLLAPLDYPPYPYISATPTNFLTSTKAYFLLPGSPGTLPNTGYTDRFEGADDGTDQRGSDDRSHVLASDLGPLFAAHSYPTKLGGSGTNSFGEVKWETNTSQSATILTAFAPIRFTVTSFLYPPPQTFAGGKVFFRTPVGTNGPSCTFTPNPATIAADNTVTVTPIANGYVGSYQVTAMTQFYPPYDYAASDILVMQLHNDGAPQVTVTNDADDGFGSLRWATRNVAGGGLITFDRDHTIHLGSVLDVNSSIDGGTNRIVISGNSTTRVMNVSESATIRNLTIADGYTAVRGWSGGVLLTGGDVNFEQVVFRNNRALEGGAIYFTSITAPNTLHLNLINCLFFGNSAVENGGAICATETDGEVRALNCTFTGNSAQSGGAINNVAVGIDAGLHETFANCIFSDNTATQYPVIHTTRLLADNSVVFSNCNVQGAFPSGSWDATLGVNGGGNIATNPLFTSAANSNFTLQAGSPCINAGHNGSVPATITKDLAGLPRISDGTVDMGAYETPYSVTVNFLGNGGTPATVSSNYVEGVAFGALPSAARTGYTFAAWTNAAGGTMATTTLVARAVTNLYARWTANPYAVTFDRQGGTGGSNAVTATYASAMPTATAPTRTGYTFGGYWDATGGGTQFYSAAMASARAWDKAFSATLYARWTTNSYTVTLDKQGGTGGSNAVTATYASAMPTATAPTRTGYIFGGYWDTTSGGTQYYSAAMGSLRPWDKAVNSTLYARWMANSSPSASTGTGADGVLLVTGTSLVDSVKTRLAANGAPGQTVINVASAAGFGVGDEALLLCLQGADAGAYEFARVASAASGSLTLNAALRHTYDVTNGARVIVQRVPNYRDVTVKSNGVLTASAWTGGASAWTPGGVVAFRVNGTLTIEEGGRVTADALGFAGGAGISSSVSADGYQGESYTLTVGAQSREPNAGAGGAGLYYSITGDGGGGGGGGGHGTAGMAGATVEPYHGLGGGSYGFPNMTAMYLGSGGGAGGTDDDGDGSSKGGQGGRGGGILYVSARTVTLAGEFSAAGADGETVQDTDGDNGDESGGGGGGAGGTLFLATDSAFAKTAEMLVPGGVGGGVEAGTMLGGVGGTGIVAFAQAEIGLWSGTFNRDTNFTAVMTVISNAEQFAQFAWLVNGGETYLGKTVSLANDIDLSAHYWVPAGSNFLVRFEGAFDGAGHAVHGLRINQPTTAYQGLFGNVGADGSVRNLTVTNVDIIGQYYVGSIAGRSFGTLSNCTVAASCSVSGTAYSVGGVVGCAEGTLFKCFNGADVTGDSAVGGVAGEANNTTTNCHNGGAVRAHGSVGGVAGIALGALSDCSNSGAVVSVSGEDAGGIAATAQGRLYRCINRGSVEGAARCGGITGDHAGERIEGCLNHGDISGTYAAGIAVNAQGLVVNCLNYGEVFGLYAGGIVEDLYENGVVRNCANHGESLGFSSAGGVVRYVETGALLENCFSAGTVMGEAGKAGGLAYRNEGVVTGSYWKVTGVEPFNTPAVASNYATVAACESFGDAPGTLAAPVTVGGVTIERLSFALNAWVSAAWTPGCGLSSWTAGADTNYPTLIPGEAPVTLTYIGGPGGTVANQAVQVIAYGTDGEPVTADSDGGAVFLRWLDGRIDNPRRDESVVTNATVTALFESAASVPIDWYDEHGFAPGVGEDWSDVDARDPHGKGMTLSEEYVAMTDPANPTSVFRMVSLQRGSSVSVMADPSSTQRVYTLQYRTSLTSEGWTNVSDQITLPGGVPLADSEMRTQRFYRVMVEMPE